MTTLDSIPITTAVGKLTAIDPAYMKLPIRDGFNWDEVFAQVGEGQWYLVVFRSRHSSNADEVQLTEFDDRAREAALTAPGYIHYFAGTPSADGDCLSFCLWESAAHAKSAARLDAHVAATTLVNYYAYYQLERWNLSKSYQREGVNVMFERLL
ncbi:MAG: hypothetical protein KF716_31590 [Anaerolineae bacterium]|nr:hypothetical protein [Anaerolineae bacterium]